MRTHRPGRPGVLLASVFAVLALAFSVWLPLWEAPDEVAHFRYITDLIDSGYRLPRQQLDDLSEAHQPPLYYALAAPLVGLADLDDPTGRVRLNPWFSWVGRGGADPNIARHGTAETFPYRGHALGLRLARLMSIVLGTLSVGFAVAIARVAFPRYAAMAIAAGGLMAFCPQFLFLSGATNNDNLLVLASTVSIWQTLRVLRAPSAPRLWVGLGVWLGIAVLAKMHGAAVAAASGLALAWHLRSRLGWPRLVRLGTLTVMPALAITLWWFIRNQVLYGDPLGMRIYESIYWMNLRHAPLDLNALRDMVAIQFESFWATFGWTTVRAPDWFYIMIGVFYAGTLAGLVAAWRGGRFAKLTGRQRQVLGFLGFAMVVQYGFVFYTITRCNESCYQGRYLFPTLSALAVWLTLGLGGPDGSRTRLAIAASALLFVAGLYLGVGVLRPAFDPVPEPKWRLWFLPQRTDAVFGDLFRLRGYRLEPPGSDGTMTVTLYWEALRRCSFDYSAFTHLIDGQGRRVGQADHPPGSDRDYPPTYWLAGDIIRDRHVMKLEAPVTGSLELWIGVYDWRTGNRLSAEAGADHTLREKALVIPVALR